MLAAALICRDDGVKDNQNSRYASQLLAEAQRMETLDMNQAICRMGSVDLLNDKNLACGYTTAKQQNLTEHPSKILQGQIEVESR